MNTITGPLPIFEEMSPTRFEQYDRKGPKIFVGEWAAYEDVMPWTEPSTHLPPTPSLKAALGDAVWMLAMERNSDLIVMQCYAPMLVNVNPGARQWRPNLIGYDAMTSYGSPSYYVISMCNDNRGDAVVQATLKGLEGKQVAPLDYAVTKDTRSGTLYIKVVNVTDAPQSMQINVDGVKRVAEQGSAVVLTSANLHDSNSILDPKKIIPVTVPDTVLSRNFTLTFAPY